MAAEQHHCLQEYGGRLDIVDTHEMRGKAVNLAVDQHYRSFLILDVPEILGTTLRRGHYEHIDSPGQELIDFLLLEFRVIVRRRQYQAVSLGSQAEPGLH